MDLATLKSWVEKQGHGVELVPAGAALAPESGPARASRGKAGSADLLVVAWSSGNGSPLPPLYVQLAEHWVLLSVLDVAMLPAYALSDLPRQLLALNSMMRVAKLALGDRDEVILCAELPTESLDESELVDAIATMRACLLQYGDYARRASERPKA